MLKCREIKRGQKQINLKRPEYRNENNEMKLPEYRNENNEMKRIVFFKIKANQGNNFI